MTQASRICHIRLRALDTCAVASRVESRADRERSTCVFTLSLLLSSLCQIAAFRNVNATAIQRMARGMQARALFRRKRAQAMVQRQMLFFLTRAFVASAKVARRIREEMRKKHVRETKAFGLQ